MQVGPGARAASGNAIQEFMDRGRRAQEAVDKQIELELKPRKRSQKERVLDMLREGPKTNVDFLNAYPRIPNFRSRLSELRDDGHKIPDGIPKRKGVWEYRLLEEAPKR